MKRLDVRRQRPILPLPTDRFRQPADRAARSPFAFFSRAPLTVRRLSLFLLLLRLPPLLPDLTCLPAETSDPLALTIEVISSY